MSRHRERESEATPTTIMATSAATKKQICIHTIINIMFSHVRKILNKHTEIKICTERRKERMERTIS
jgi:hypothetical protein